MLDDIDKGFCLFAMQIPNVGNVLQCKFQTFKTLAKNIFSSELNRTFDVDITCMHMESGAGLLLP
jgi:hypothetical protein